MRIMQVVSVAVLATPFPVKIKPSAYLRDVIFYLVATASSLAILLQEVGGIYFVSNYEPACAVLHYSPSCPCQLLTSAHTLDLQEVNLWQAVLLVSLYIAYICVLLLSERFYSLWRYWADSLKPNHNESMHRLPTDATDYSDDDSDDYSRDSNGSTSTSTDQDSNDEENALQGYEPPKLLEIENCEDGVRGQCIADGGDSVGNPQSSSANDEAADRKSTRLNSSHPSRSRMPSSA